MPERLSVAVVGATGAVGREIIKVLQQRSFPLRSLLPLATSRSAGSRVEFRGTSVEVMETVPDSFDGIDLALFAGGGTASRDFAPEAVRRGAVVIDNSSAFRMQPDVPLVVPEVNSSHLHGHRGLIANPNCSTIQMVVALKPIYDAAGIERIVVCTYQAVSGTGKEAIDELESQVRDHVAGKAPRAEVYPHPIAFNVLPHIDRFTDNGYTAEEMKMVNETRKIFGDEDIAISATAVRVPVFYGHSEAVNLQTKRKLGLREARDILRQAPGVRLLDDPSANLYPTPLQIAGGDDVLVGRLREDISQPMGLEMWVVADNLRKGAALNAVQIAEKMMDMDLL